MYKEKLVNIFGEDLFEKENLLDIFLGLTGNAENKPFDCVGTYEEVNFAISKTIKNVENSGLEIPFLLRYYKDNFGVADMSVDLTRVYNEENNLEEEQDKLLRGVIFDDDKRVD